MYIRSPPKFEELRVDGRLVGHRLGTALEILHVIICKIVTQSRHKKMTFETFTWFTKHNFD